MKAGNRGIIKQKKFCDIGDGKDMVFNMVMMAAGQRLTWEQIRAAYPDQWVALTDVEYIGNDGINVKSAVVVCNMADRDYTAQRLKFMQEGKRYEYERTEDTRGFVGVTV